MVKEKYFTPNERKLSLKFTLEIIMFKNKYNNLYKTTDMLERGTVPLDINIILVKQFLAEENKSCHQTVTKCHQTLFFNIKIPTSLLADFLQDTRIFTVYINKNKSKHLCHITLKSFNA